VDYSQESVEKRWRNGAKYDPKSGKTVGFFGKKCADHCEIHCKNSEIRVGKRGYAQMVFTKSPMYPTINHHGLQRGICI